MEKDKPVPEELNLATRKMWTSRDIYKAVSSAAVAVFVLTMIYAQFLSMGKDIEFMKVTHAAEIVSLVTIHKADIKVLTERIDTQNKRLVAEDDKAEDERDANAATIILLKLDAHEPAAGQKRIHR